MVLGIVIFLLFCLLGFFLYVSMARQEVRNKRLIKLKKSVHLLKEGSFGAPQNFSEQAQTFFQDLGVWVEKKKLVSQKTLDTIRVGIGSKVFYRFLGAKLCSLVGGIFLFIFCGLLFGNWAFPMAFPILGLVLPDMVMSRWRSRYVARVQEGMADALDLMVICVEVGMPAEVAIARVANEMELLHPAVAVELKLTVQDFQVIPDRIEVFRMLARRTGLPIMKQISSVLIQSIELGTPLGEAFRTLADDSKKETILRFQEKVAQIPALMTIPMILFILPVLFIILMAPAILGFLAAKASAGG